MAFSTASTVGPSVGPRGHAFAHCVMRDTEGRAARPLARVVLPQIRAQLAATGTSTASTAGVLEAPLARARARHATRDTVVPTARPPVRALPPQSRARTGATATSTASTVALLVEPLARARVHHAARGTKVRAARLPVHVRQTSTCPRMCARPARQARQTPTGIMLLEMIRRATRRYARLMNAWKQTHVSRV